LERDVVKVGTEDEAYSFIERYLAGKSLPESISFSGWPSLTFRLTGEKFDRSLTPSVMKGFIELQDQLNKSYALARYGVPDARKLSKEEREALEIEVKVGKGSSIVEVNMDGFLTKLLHELVGKMGPQEIMITALGAAVIFGGVAAFKLFLNNRK